MTTRWVYQSNSQLVVELATLELELEVAKRSRPVDEIEADIGNVKWLMGLDDVT